MKRPALIVSVALDDDELDMVLAVMRKTGAASPASAFKAALCAILQDRKLAA